MQWLVGVLIKSALDWIAKFVGELFAKMNRIRVAHETAKSEAAQANQKIKQSSPDDSQEKIDDAIDDSLRKL